MQVRRRDIFDTVKTEGGLLPADFLLRIVEGDGDIQGLTSEAYHLAKSERLGEAATRAWNRLLGAWESFRTAAENLPDSDAGTTLTRERWLLILFQELGYGRLTTSKAYEIEGRTYPISHMWQKAPIHLVSFRLELDRRAPGVAGAARVSPHSLMQEFLNRSEDYLWGFLSNGCRLRILRDNVSLSRASYVEFDLQAMMDSEAYSDFFLLYLLCHQSRVEVPEDKPPEQCWLEKWRNTAAREGTRVLDRLRDGVQQAIETLGGGFLAHPANGALRESLRSGELGTQEYYRQVLRVVYRLLFLFVAEDRGLILDPGASETARETYTEHYSTRRLRRLAERRRGTRHPDLYRALRLVFGNLYSGCAELALPALGSYLFRPDSTADLNDADLRNSCLLAAIRHLAFTVDENVLRPVDYRNLGPEELGSVYESLLEMHPRINTEAAAFALEVVAGSERKSTGSYYTPTSLVNCLLDSAFDPVLDDACKAPDPEGALLGLKVCDPACGSGHFLIAAANRLAKRLAAVRAGEDEPAPESIRHALRDVIGRCVYGVDVNPMAVELCRINLWLESVEPGRPLSFLDHHIQCGNSLLGTTPALLEDGIPDDAFKPLEGDVKSVCKEFKKRNRQERKELEKGQSTFGFAAPLGIKLGNLPATFARLDAIDDSTLEGVEKKREQYARLVSSSDYKYGRLLADAWCAAFVWKKDTPETHGGDAITEFTFRRIEENPHALAPWMGEEIKRLRDQYRFFHWHLAFPDAFRLPGNEEEPENQETGWSGGFDCVLGNPPWLRQELLKPYKQLLVAFRSFTSTADSSVYFLERSVDITCPPGRIALLTPNKWLRANYAGGLRELLRQRCRVHLLIDFGHSRKLFPGVDTFPAAVVLEPTGLPVDGSAVACFVQAHDEDREREGLQALIINGAVHVPHRNLRSDRWQLEDASTSDLLDRLLATGQTLESSLEGPILRGLLSGLNEAFYVDTATRDAAVASDPASETVFKKLMRGRDVKRWVPLWDDQWHVVIPSSQNHTWPWSAAANEAEAERVFAATYPAVHDHLKPFEERLRARKDKGCFWWELRACDYYDAFEKPKIIVQCIAYYSRFAFDDQGHFVNNKAIIFPTDDLCLLAILNSRIIWWVVNRTFQHMKDDGLSVDVQFLKLLPVPTVTDGARERIESLVRDLIAAVGFGANATQIAPLELRLDELVEEAFRLTDAERELLVSSLPPRDPLTEFEGIGAPAATVPTTVDQVHMGRVVAYINLLLHTWGIPVVRDALEAGLVFMLNDSIRQKVLRGSQPAARTATGGRGRIVAGMDSVLSNMKANGTIDTTSESGRMVAYVGQKPVPIANVPAGDVAKAKEAIQAVQKLGESRTLDYFAGVIDAEYAVVP